MVVVRVVRGLHLATPNKGGEVLIEKRVFDCGRVVEIGLFGLFGAKF